jgi:hypothetical protein
MGRGRGCAEFAVYGPNSDIFIEVQVAALRPLANDAALGVH